MQAFGWVLVFAGSFALGWSYLDAGGGSAAAPVMITGALLAAGGAIAQRIGDLPLRQAPQRAPHGPQPVCALEGLLKPVEDERQAAAAPSDLERRVLNAAVEALTEGAYSWDQVPEAIQQRWLELLQGYAKGAELDPDDARQLAGFVNYARTRRA